MHCRSFSLLIGVALLATGCGNGGTERDGSLDGPLRVEVDTAGDTVVVHTRSGSVWGTARLVEELRIGVLDGAEHEMFGRVGALAVDPSGDVLVYDAHASAVRRYGSDGRYLGTIGGPGSGPGEYRNVAGMAVLDDGRLVLHDFGNGRFNVYSLDGDLLETWPVQPAIAAMRPLHRAPGGGVFLHDLRLRAGEGTRDEILVRLDDRGVPGDTSLLPHSDYRPPALLLRSEQGSVGMTVPFSPVRGWSVTAGGEVVAMLGHRYALDVHRADGSVLRIGRAVTPVPVTAEERAAEEDRVTTYFRRTVEGWRWDGPTIPATKPPLQWLHTGEDGTIWARVAQPGRASAEGDRTPGARTFVDEPIVLDVFEPDGTFLGQVHAPRRMQLNPYPVFRRDHVWAVVQDENGADFVVRSRIVRERANGSAAGRPARDL